jgi:hypothetical protein
MPRKRSDSDSDAARQEADTPSAAEAAGGRDTADAAQGAIEDGGVEGGREQSGEPEAVPGPTEPDTATTDQPEEPAGFAADAASGTEDRAAAAAPEPGADPGEPAYGTAAASTPRVDEPHDVPTAPPLAHEDAGEAHEYEVHEEEHRSSFAARALTFLILLIAGAALGIWGAPKLAPMLPSGLSPVAEWLTPGVAETEERMAALEANLQGDIANLQGDLSELREQVQSGPDAAAIDARIAAQAAETEARLNDAVTQLRDQLAALDPEALRQRVSSIESTVAGQQAELASIGDQIAGGAAAGSAAGEQTQEQIDLYRAEVEGLRAEVSQVQEQVAGLEQRLDEISAAADRRVEEAEAEAAEVQQQAETQLSQAGLEANMALVRAALNAGQPYTEPLERIAAQPEITVPKGLSAAADTGAPPIAQLRDRFPDAAHDAIRASIMASAGDGVLARSRAFLEAQIASRSLTPQPGLSPDAVLSRMEAALRQGDLQAALAEADSLPEEAKAAMQDWLAGARLRAGAEDGLAALTADVSAVN